MTGISEEYAVLLAAPNPVTADLAQQLLKARGIPSMLHGQDRDLAELGHSHGMVAQPDVMVPKEALERAKAVLEEAWGPGGQPPPLPEGYDVGDDAE